MTPSERWLLLFAISYIRQVQDEYEMCNFDHSAGRVTDPDIARDIAKSKAWLKKARAAVSKHE